MELREIVYDVSNVFHSKRKHYFPEFFVENHEVDAILQNQLPSSSLLRVTHVSELVT